MIKELKIFTVICDNCGADAFEGTEHSGYSDEGFVKEEAIEDGWKEEEEKHYCPKCYKYDDDDNLVIVKPSLPNGKNALAALKKLSGIFSDEERETMFDYDK